MTELDAQILISEALKAMPDRAMSNVIRHALFKVADVNWASVIRKIYSEMPELLPTTKA